MNKPFIIIIFIVSNFFYFLLLVICFLQGVPEETGEVLARVDNGNLAVLRQGDMVKSTNV